MAYTLYTGVFDNSQDTYLRLTGNPYRIITGVTLDGNAITPINGTTASASASDCTNSGVGILSGSYKIGRLTSSSSTVNVTSVAYTFSITYHYYGGPSSASVDTQTKSYDTAFLLKTPDDVDGYKFIGWAVGSQNSSIVIPPETTNAILTESDCISSSPAELKIPTLYASPDTTLHLYAKWRVCGPVAITVTVTDNTPITAQISIQTTI